MKNLQRAALWAAIAVASFTLVCWLQGSGFALERVRLALEMLAGLAPQLAVGLSFGALVSALIPRSRIAGALGPESGMRGILLATGLGMVLPGGPFASFPIVVAMARSGVGVGALVAMLVSWATIGIYRVVIWELPLMGPGFAVTRVLVSLPLPIIAGLTAQILVRRFRLLRPDWLV